MVSTLDRQYLVHLSEQVYCKANQPVFREGDSADYLYVLLTGQVVLTQRKRGALVEYKPNHLLGDYEVMAGLPRVTTATASVHSSLVRIPATQFFHHLAPPTAAEFNERNLPKYCYLLS